MKEYQNATGFIFDLADSYLSNLLKFGSFISFDENAILLNYTLSLSIASIIAGVAFYLLIKRNKSKKDDF